MQRNPHSYQIATGYRTFYSLSLIYQPITKKRLFFHEKQSAMPCTAGVSENVALEKDIKNTGSPQTARKMKKIYYWI